MSCETPIYEDPYSAAAFERRLKRQLKTRRKNSIIFSLILLLMMGIPFCCFVAMVCYSAGQFGADDTKGPAPNADYATRRAWGESELKHHFKRVDRWIRKSGQIAEDVGVVTGVAPIGAPNYFNSYWAESDASMNLQVIGTNGEGILCLPDVCADHPDYIYGLERDSKWTFNGISYPVIVKKSEGAGQ